jgi:hypothetical protein
MLVDVECGAEILEGLATDRLRLLAAVGECDMLPNLAVLAVALIDLPN